MHENYGFSISVILFVFTRNEIFVNGYKSFSIVPKFVDGTDSCGLSGQNREKNRLGKGRN